MFSRYCTLAKILTVAISFFLSTRVSKQWHKQLFDVCRQRMKILEINCNVFIQQTQELQNCFTVVVLMPTKTWNCIVGFLWTLALHTRVENKLPTVNQSRGRPTASYWKVNVRPARGLGFPKLVDIRGLFIKKFRPGLQSQVMLQAASAKCSLIVS